MLFRYRSPSKCMQSTPHIIMQLLTRRRKILKYWPWGYSLHIVWNLYCQSSMIKEAPDKGMSGKEKLSRKTHRSVAYRLHNHFLPEVSFISSSSCNFESCYNPWYTSINTSGMDRGARKLKLLWKDDTIRWWTVLNKEKVLISKVQSRKHWLSSAISGKQKEHLSFLAWEGRRALSQHP